jgi:hypothetical protein
VVDLCGPHDPLRPQEPAGPLVRCARDGSLDPAPGLGATTPLDRPQHARQRDG